MKRFHSSAPLIAAITVSLYFQVALVPSVVLAQPASEDRGFEHRVEAPSLAAAPLPSGAGEGAQGEELGGVSDADRAFASLPSGGAPVSGQAVALPSGAATTTGMGESFSAQLSTGAASMTLPFSLPSARGRVQPSLALSYGSAGGFGLAGVGWSLGSAAISRQTDRGIPRYDDRDDYHPEQDRFMLGGAELVPICTVRGGLCEGALPGERMPAWADRWQYFRPRIEGMFIRVFWSPDHRTWRVQSKDGTNLELGVPLDGTGYTGALDYDPERPRDIFRWSLVREYDSQGEVNGRGAPRPVNVLVFRYLRDGNVAYLSDLYDTSPADDPTSTDLSRFAHHTRIDYEPRPDRAVSYRAGFRMEYGLRLRQVTVTSKPFAGPNVTTAPRELVRRYYARYLEGQHRSLLSTVQPEGRCAAAIVEDTRGDVPATSCARLPAVRFEYQRIESKEPALVDARGLAFDPLVTTLKTLDNSPPHSLDEPEVALVDANLDGLPDVLATAPSLYQGRHALFFNGEDGALGFGARVDVPVERLNGVTAGVLRLSNINVAPLDLDADGSLDLVHMPFVKRYEVFSLEAGEAGDTPRWRGRAVRTAAEQDPKINFARDSRDTRVMDVNGDGLVDIVYTSPTEVQTFFALGRYPGGDGRFGQGKWTGPETAALTTEPVRSCAPWSAQSVRFSSPDVHVADMNGDGLADLVRVRNAQILYWPGRGNGMWGTGDRRACRGGEFGADQHIQMERAPHLGVVAPGRMLLADLNGDGLSDMVELRARAVDVYLNDNGERFTERFTIDGTPFLPNHASYVQLSDLDGSGTPDLVWGKANDYRYIDLTGGVTPHLLVRTHNGLGRTMQLDYRASTELMREAAERGEPWESRAPTAFPALVRTVVSDNLDRIGRPATRVVTEYAYRNPVFEGRQREFRGFRAATTTTLGDENHPTSSMRTEFLLGECEDDDVDDGVEICSPSERWRDHPREALKGLTALSETADAAGVFHHTQAPRYELRELYRGRDGRVVRVALPIGKVSYFYDTADFDGVEEQVLLPAALTLRRGAEVETQDRLLSLRSRWGRARTETSSTFDDFGNIVSVAEAGCTEGCPGGVDEVLYARSTYALPQGDRSGWLWREQGSFVEGSEHAGRRQVVRHELDARGNRLRSFATLSGTLPLRRAHAAGRATAPAPSTQSGGVTTATEIRLTDNTYDLFGHVVAKQGPGGCVSSDVDPAYAHLVVETRTQVGAAGPDGCGTLTLRQEVSYDRGLEQVVEAWDANDRPARFTYDGLGRVTSATFGDPERPGMLASLPSMRVSYDLTVDPWQRPYSITRVDSLDGPTPNEGVYRTGYTFMDGLGRTLSSVAPADPSAGDGGEWLVSGRVDYDAKGSAFRSCVPFFYTGDPLGVPRVEPPTTDPAALEGSAAPFSGCQHVLRDGFGRDLSQFSPKGELQVTMRYHALTSDVLDPLDLPGGERAGTYATGILDGHGRQVAQVERYREQGQLRERRTSYQYLPTGEVTRVTQSVSGGEELVRWLRYDSLGRLVLNVEPNTTPDFTDDESVAADQVRAWRYAYDDAGRLVGTSDARGCGANYHYDAAGRPVATDYSPCEAQHADYTAPNLQTGEGTESFVRYDVPDAESSTVTDAAGNELGLTLGTMLGQLASVSDRGSKAIYRYDALGRGTGVGLRLAKPGAPSSVLGERYAPRWYVRQTVLDASDRPLSVTTGSTVAELSGRGGESRLVYEYAGNGAVRRIGGSYGTLFAGSVRHADGRVKSVTMGDAASTQRRFLYDDNFRLKTAQTYRSNLPFWTDPNRSATYSVPGASDPPTQQMLLEDLEYRYDRVGNLSAIEDHRVPEEWPAEAAPVSRSFGYDDLYRLTSVSYQHHGSSAWRSPFAAELKDAEREQPSPHVSFDARVGSQTFAQDAFGRMVESTDDAQAFWDRSTGTRRFGTKRQGPHQLLSASNRQLAPESTRKGDLQARYDDAGNMTDLVVAREGPCLPSESSCTQRFHYEWDEIGNLTRARRWDLAAGAERTEHGSLALSGAPLSITRSPDAELEYAYSGTSRVRKTSLDDAGEERHTLYIFGSLELRRAAFTSDYTLDARTEQVRLGAGPITGRVVHSQDDLPSLTSGGQHVFLQFGDHLGSTSFVIDHGTGELVEHTTYAAFGSVDSAYRPERWGSQREPYKFTGKEDDIEVGLVYFGARYYSPHAAVWLSPDPVNIHELGSDMNPYGYVGGSPLMAVDPDGRDFGISLLIVAVVAAVIAMTASAVSQGINNGWSNINWGIKGVVGAGLVAFASTMVGGYVGAAVSGVVSGVAGATAGTLAGGVVGGAAAGATGYLVGAGVSGQSVTGAGLGKAIAVGAVSGLASGAVGSIPMGGTGGSWFSSLTSAAAGTTCGTGLSVAMGGSFDSTDFAISLGASLAGAAANRGVRAAQGAGAPGEQAPEQAWDEGDSDGGEASGPFPTALMRTPSAPFGYVGTRAFAWLLEKLAWAIPVGGAEVAAAKGVVGAATAAAAERGAVTAAARGGLCFAAGTPVHTADGEKPIEEVKPGDFVWSQDGYTGEVVLRQVVRTFVTPDQAVVDVVLEDHDGGQEEIRATPKHPFWTDRGWVAASELSIEDQVLRRSGSWSHVVAVRGTDERVTVFNFEVEQFHSYFVGAQGLLVHNDSALLSAGKNFKDHFITKRPILERALGIKVGKFSEGGGGTFLKAISEGINNGTFKHVGQGTLKAGQEAMNIYRGHGLTVVTRTSGEWVTLLKSGEGMDLAIRMLP